MVFSLLLPMIPLLHHPVLSAFDAHYSNIPTIHHSMGIAKVDHDKNHPRWVPQKSGVTSWYEPVIV